MLRTSCDCGGHAAQVDLDQSRCCSSWQGPGKPASEGAPAWGGADESVIEPFVAALACIRSAHCPKWHVFGAMHSVGHGSSALQRCKLKTLQLRLEPKRNNTDVPPSLIRDEQPINQQHIA